MALRHVVQRMHPILADVLQRLEGYPSDAAFMRRVRELAALSAFGDDVDKVSALAAYEWVLQRVDGDGVPLTDAGYVKPAEVRAWAEVLPQMRGWIHSMTREVDVLPVSDLRETLRLAGLVRRYRGRLRLTRKGKTAAASAGTLWDHLRETLVQVETPFEADIVMVVLVHMATSNDCIDVAAVAATLADLGWRYEGGSAVPNTVVWHCWNDLWVLVGNVGDWHPEGGIADRRPTDAGRALIRDALFEHVSPDEVAAEQEATSGGLPG